MSSFVPTDEAKTRDEMDDIRAVYDPVHCT